MSTERLHRLIGHALTDPMFRHRLLGDPGEASRDFQLTGAEWSLVASLRASTLEEFSRLLDQRLGETEAGVRACDGPAEMTETEATRL